MSGSAVQIELVRTDLNLNYGDTSALTRLDDAGIDDPVNDTGLGPHLGDLKMSDEFACLVNLICMEHGDFR